jgi:hypothetical protein
VRFASRSPRKTVLRNTAIQKTFLARIASQELAWKRLIIDLSATKSTNCWWVLEHGPINATNFLPTGTIEARSSCSCGCPSIEFSVPADTSFIDSPQGMRAHFLGRSGEDEVGLMLTAGSGVLSELEVYTFGEVDHPFDLPAIDTLRRAS